MEYLYLIRWNKSPQNTYNYGSQIDFGSQNRVTFKNPMMPPGTNIHEWSSQTRFDRDRDGPGLPLLIPQKKYRLVAGMQVEPVNSCYFQLHFFDRFDDLITEINLDFMSEHAEFVVPAGTQYYQLFLVNVSQQKIVFDYLLLADVNVFNNYDIEVDEQTNINIVPKAGDSDRPLALKLVQRTSKTAVLPINAAAKNKYLLLDRYEANDKLRLQSKIDHFVHKLVQDKTINQNTKVKIACIGPQQLAVQKLLQATLQANQLRKLTKE